jgi:ABC-type bacteriocin/lantibiotic exporter with double-glycine peptidase domain
VKLVFPSIDCQVSIVAQAAIVLVVWYGGQLVINGQMDTGNLLSFLLYTLTVAASIAVLSNSFGEYAGAVGTSFFLHSFIYLSSFFFLPFLVFHVYFCILSSAIN